MTQQLCSAVAADPSQDEAEVSAGRRMTCFLRTDRSDDLALYFGQFMDNSVVRGLPRSRLLFQRDGAAWFAEIFELQSQPRIYGISIA
jgi:hypothetical protein